VTSWRERIGRDHRRRRRQYAVASSVAVVAYVAMILLTVLGWNRFFGGMIPPGLLEFVIEPIAAVVFGLFAAFGPKPVIGLTSPEEAAADAFFAGKDVRSDDDKLDQDVS
jgi:hypothetical protein